jgi:hypothetical protein
MGAQQGLLPTNIQNISIAPNSPFSKGVLTTQVSLDPVSNPSVRLQLYNGVYDSFKVQINCVGSSVMAWYATGSNIASALINTYGCG